MRRAHRQLCWSLRCLSPVGQLLFRALVSATVYTLKRVQQQAHVFVSELNHEQYVCLCHHRCYNTLPSTNTHVHRTNMVMCTGTPHRSLWSSAWLCIFHIWAPCCRGGPWRWHCPCTHGAVQACVDERAAVVATVVAHAHPHTHTHYPQT